MDQLLLTAESVLGASSDLRRRRRFRTTLIGGMQVRGAGLVPGLLDDHLVADDARGES